jgi:ubiquinone/menaquinone biosynthesis C-methylase UbiE
MNLLDLVNRTPNPAPWAEGEKIPWNEPAFSARMLREHLSQDHDAASRRAAIIDRQVDWIFNTVLQGRPRPVLDLGCGPGLYSNRLARLGCRCTGIDFSPASIEYARQQAKSTGSGCEYIEGDLRQVSFGENYGLVMFIFGELNVFRPGDAKGILHKAWAALQAGGLILLEPHTFEAVREIGCASSTWSSASSGLFSTKPHLYLQENFWDEAGCTSTTRYIIIDAQNVAITRYAATMQAYSDEQYKTLLEESGFHQVEFHPSITGQPEPETHSLLALTAKK